MFDDICFLHSFSVHIILLFLRFEKGVECHRDKTGLIHKEVDKSRFLMGSMFQTRMDKGFLS